VVSSELLQRWDQTLPGHLDLGRRLIVAWSSPERVYHGATHLLACLNAWQQLGGHARAEALALWFHDLIHHNQPGLDERASAAAAATELGDVGLAHAEIDEVTRLVLATIDHRPLADDHAAARVCDADLAILGASPLQYQASVVALRAEFATIDDGQWQEMRRRQLQALRERDRLFSTPLGAQLWEASARRNLQTEWQQLSDQASNGAGSPAP
jgi:predicted metal-dependent HD superfamily phosphohydrolase